MLKPIKFGIGATLLAAAQLSTASTAEITVTNLTLSTAGGQWWSWIPSEVDWVPITSGASAELLNPAAADAVTAWHGNTVVASVTDGGSWAEANINAGTPPPAGEPAGLNGVSASARVAANDSQSGWAFANIFAGRITVGGNATITLTATIDTINASGSAQANAYIDMCSIAPITEEVVCDAANAAEAFVDGVSGAYTGPTILTASWTNPGDTTYAYMSFGLTASADSTAPVPEPATWALALSGLAGLGALRKKLLRAA